MSISPRATPLDPLQRLAVLPPARAPTPVEDMGPASLSVIATALGSVNNYGSVLSNVRMALQGAASVIRERLSVDSRKLLGKLEAQLVLEAKRFRHRGCGGSRSLRTVRRQPLPQYRGWAQENKTALEWLALPRHWAPRRALDQHPPVRALWPATRRAPTISISCST